METTFPRLMLEHAKARPQAPALREKEYGIWQTTTWRALADEVAALACGMAEAGLSAGQHIVIVGDNRPRLYACMLAAQSLGAIPVPLYQDAVATEMAFPINNAEVAFAVVEDQEQVDKLIELRESCPQLARIWYDDPRGLRKYDEPGLASLDDLIKTGQARQQREPGFFAAAVARVIAGGHRTSPLLLVALQLYLAHASEPECAIWRHVQQKARAAIAKATGGAPCQ